MNSFIADVIQENAVKGGLKKTKSIKLHLDKWTFSEKQLFKCKHVAGRWFMSISMFLHTSGTS